nr:hypothetical protein [Tanacetum cinerariifolium]
MPLYNKKEKMTIEKCKGIDMLSEVALTEEAQFEEVRKKSLRDFYKTHPSGSRTVTKTTPSAAKIKPSITNEGTGVKPRVPNVTEEESSKSETESWGNDEDERNNEQDSRSERINEENDSDDKNTQSDSEKGSASKPETDKNESDSESDQEENKEETEDDEEEKEDEFVRTSSNDSDDETKIFNKAEGDEDEEMDYATSQLYDDIDIRLNKPVQANDETVQKEDIDTELTNIQQGNENQEISQVIEDAHVTLSTVPQKTNVPVTSSSHSSDLASNFLNFLNIPHTYAEIVSPIDVHVLHEVPSKQTPTLLTVPLSVITESSLIYSTIIPQSIPFFIPPLPHSTPTPPPTTEAINPPSTLFDFALVFQFNNRVIALEKEVVKLKKDDPLKTQVISLVDEHLDARLGATRDEFMNFLLASITTRIIEQVKNQLPQILPEEVSNFAPCQLYDDIDIRLNKPVQANDETVQKEDIDTELTNIQQGNENQEISQVIEDAHVTLSTVPQKTNVPVTSSSHSSDLASNFLNFLNIPHTYAEIVSPIDVHVLHEVPSKQTPTLLTVIPQSIPFFIPPLPHSTPTPPPTTEAINPPSTLFDFALVFQFNNRVIALEKEVVKLKKDDPLKTQVISLVDEHLDARLGATRDEFMNFLLASITTRIIEQVKNQLPQILPEESSYEAAASLTEFELKKMLIDKMYKSESYLATPKHRVCYDGLIKSYELNKTLFSTYDKVYSLKRSRKDKDKDKDPFVGSDRGLKKRKTRKDSEEPEFEVADSDMPQDQKENPGNDDEEPKGKVASKRDWFTKPKRPQEPTDPDWNDKKTPQQGPTQSWLMKLTSSADKPSKTFDELMSTLIDFSAYIMNGLKITNLTQETLLGPTFRLLKGTRGDYPFDLTKPIPLFMNGNRQMVLVYYFFNNDLKYLQGGISTMTYTTSLTNTKATQYDLPSIKDIVQNIWSLVKVTYDKHALWVISHWRDQRKSFYVYARGLESTHDVYYTKHILAVTRVNVMRKHGYGYLKEIVVRRADNDLYKFKEEDFPRLRINDIKDMLLLVVQNRLTNLSGDDVLDFVIASRMFTRSIVIQKRVEDLQLTVESYQKKINITKKEITRLGIRKKDLYTSYQDPQGFIYVDTRRRNRLMRLDEH